MFSLAVHLRILLVLVTRGALGSIVGRGTVLQAGKVAGSVPDEVIAFFS
jgi:hypothetical protein